ncbi:MAG TPA: hypothetical protein VGZ48_01920 [Candidatus Acidoferrales bacterium]|jgi:hypothetical protein|nr:hypothetical protein [Candidatus Acidoferrales bacterium]
MALYTNAWNDYKSRRNIALAAFTCEIILFAAVFFLTPHTTPYITVLVVVIALAFVNMFLSYRWTAWPCPKCGRPFLGAGRVNPVAGIALSALRNKCLRCGLTKSEIIANS